MSLSARDNAWVITENTLSARTTASLETLFAQANGFRCLRGTSAFQTPDQPGNFLAGVFDQGDATVTELVNAPNPLPLAVYVDYDQIDPAKKGWGGYERRLDLETGLVSAKVRFHAGSGATLDAHYERLVSFADKRRWGEEWTFRALDFSRRILLVTGIDATVLSSAHHPVEATSHVQVSSLVPCSPGQGVSGLRGTSRTIDLGIELAEAQTLVGPAGLTLVKVRSLAGRIEAVWSLDLVAGQTVVVHRLGVTRTSRDHDFVAGALESDTDAALGEFVREGYAAERERHVACLRQLWNRIDVAIEGDDRAARALRYNLFQLASCANPDDDRVSIGAKGLHGEGYKGHVFWDTETFMMPFFTFTQPQTALSLLRYRFNTLEGARSNARAGGHRGARFAWESAHDGTETTPKWGVDYAGNRVRIWTGDIEVHINADITHAVLKYYQVTGDRGFLLSCGLPVLVEIAQFWASYVTFDTSKGRYEIRGVIGPDEFHEHIDNNTYTNFLVRWALNRTCDLVETLKQQEPQRMGELLAQAQVADLDLALWRDVARRLHVPVAPQGDLIEQFEGYFGLKEYPIAAHDENGMPLWPEGLDLTALGATTLIKQPDVVMLFALLGEEFSPEVKTLNYEFYEARTMHKSSLSPSMYAMVGLSIGKTEHAYQYFLKAAETDLVDNQGNTSHGIHTANMGGVWQTAVFGFGGLSVSATGQPSVDPWLPKNWTALSYRFVWQGVGIRVRVTPKSVEIVAEEATSLLLGGAEVNLEAGIAVQRPRT